MRERERRERERVGGGGGCVRLCLRICHINYKFGNWTNLIRECSRYPRMRFDTCRVRRATKEFCVLLDTNNKVILLHFFNVCCLHVHEYIQFRVCL